MGRPPRRATGARVFGNRDRYNRMAAFYQALVRLGSFSRFYLAVAEAVADARGGMIVDVGCGPGTLVPHLLPRVGPTGSVLGTDVSDAMIDRARALAEREGWTNVRFERADVRDFSPDAPASVVVFCLSLTTLPDPKRCLSRALEWLEPGGQLVVLDSFLGADRRLASLVIRVKSPLVGAEPTAITLDAVGAGLDSVRIRHLNAGVYTLVSGRKRARSLTAAG